MVYDAHNDVLRYIPPIQNGINADSFGCFRITAKPNGILLSYPPFGSPGDITVQLVAEVLTIDLIEHFLQVEITANVAQYPSPWSAGSLSNFVRVACNELSQRGWWFSVSALDKARQRTENLCVCFEEHVMEPHRVTAIGRPDVYHRVGIVGNGEVDRFAHQAGDGLLETGSSPLIVFLHTATRGIRNRYFLLHDFSVNF